MYAIFVSLSNLAIWCFTRDPILQRRRIQHATSFWIRTGLRTLRFIVTVENAERLSASHSRLIIANHISTVDILALYAVNPATFVASVEVGNTAIAGFLSKIGGALFIERRSIKYLRREVATVADLLESGFDVVIFPEGTTTDGRGPLLPFKTAFFAAAAQKNVPILPIAIRYLSVDGEPANEDHVERIAYYGDIPFMTHLKRTLSLRSLVVRLTVLEPVAATNYNRDELGNMLRERIEAARRA